MAAMQRRRASSGSARRSRRTAGARRPSKAKGKILSASSFRGKGAISSARRTLAKGASKVSPKLNRELI